MLKTHCKSNARKPADVPLTLKVLLGHSKNRNRVFHEVILGDQHFANFTLLPRKPNHFKHWSVAGWWDGIFAGIGRLLITPPSDGTVPSPRAKSCIGCD